MLTSHPCLISLWGNERLHWVYYGSLNFIRLYFHYYSHLVLHTLLRLFKNVYNFCPFISALNFSSRFFITILNQQFSSVDKFPQIIFSVRDRYYFFQFISDYNGEDHHFTKIGPGGLINLEKIYRTQAVMDHISLCHQHYHTRNRLSPTITLINYLK